MTPERWQQVKDCCNRVLDCRPNLRTARLLEVCGQDQDLLREVQTMLAEATANSGVLNAPVWARLGVGLSHTATVGGGTSARWTPDTIGRYRVLRLVGEGGMGAVYEAAQHQPHRTVALKVIRPGLASAQLIRRFE